MILYIERAREMKLFKYIFHLYIYIYIYRERETFPFYSDISNQIRNITVKQKYLVELLIYI